MCLLICFSFLLLRGIVQRLLHVLAWGCSILTPMRFSLVCMLTAGLCCGHPNHGIETNLRRNYSSDENLASITLLQCVDAQSLWLTNPGKPYTNQRAGIAECTGKRAQMKGNLQSCMGKVLGTHLVHFSLLQSISLSVIMSIKLKWYSLWLALKKIFLFAQLSYEASSALSKWDSHR